MQALSAHPDRAFVRYISEGLQWGFRIGFWNGSPLRSAISNMRSASEHPEIISQYLQDELSRGRMLGPFSDTRTLPPLQINHFSVIPKGHSMGRWRLITDLSFPQGLSVDDGIDPSFCSMAYVTFDEVTNLVNMLATGTLMAKWTLNRPIA